MKIDLKNYESWFLDYYEGTLSAEKVAELFLFLEQHSNLKNEFESFELININYSDSVEIFENKADLKKNNVPTISTIDEWLTAELEGDLNLQQRSVLLTFLSENPQFNRDKNLFQLTKLKADASIIFEGKSKLKKGDEVKIYPLRVWYAVAASLIILIGGWFAFRVIDNNHKFQNANNTTIAPGKIEHKINNIDHLADSKNNKVIPPISKENTIEKNIAVIHTNKKSPLENKKTTVPSENNLAQKISSNEGDKKNQIEQVALMTPKSSIEFPEEVPFVFAQRKYIPKSESQLIHPIEALPSENISEKVIDNIKDFALENVNKVTSEKPLLPSEKVTKLPLKSRLIRFTSATINKITNNHVKVKTVFNPINGTLAAYEFEMGKKVWQKQF